MPSTPAERRALAVVAAVAALGVVARIVRAREARPAPTAAETRAIDAQIARVESARVAARGSGGRGSQRTRRPAPVRESNPIPERPEPKQEAAPRGPVDLDVASVAAIESLPWIGPSLAARIVESRERCGPFGSLESLTRVYGIGAGMVRRLEPHVTFSTSSRPIDAGRAPGCQGSAKSAASRRRGRS